MADTGTIFLDEIGEMDLNLQSKLLRVLQEREIEAIGSTKAKKVDVRIIAATNAELEQLVAEKKVPRGFVLPIECCKNQHTSLTRKNRRHPIVNQSLSRKVYKR